MGMITDIIIGLLEIAKAYATELAEIAKDAQEVAFFFKKLDDDVIIQLPYLPESLKLNLNGNTESINIVNLGDVSIPKIRKPMEITFESFFPAADYLPGVMVTDGGFWPPRKYIDYFKTLMKKKSPVLFTVTGFPRISIKCIIDSFEYSWNGGSNDCDYSIKLIEYRPIEISKIKMIKRYKKKKKKKKKNTRSSNSKKITVGCKVILNGATYETPGGIGKKKTYKNYECKVNFIWKKDADGKKCSHPYHLVSPSGKFIGYTNKASIKRK